MTITLQIGDAATKPLKEFGFATAILTLTHQAIDTLKLTIKQPFESAPLMETGTKCILRVDGAVCFVGWLDQEPSEVAAVDQTMSYVLSGPWRLLDRKPYKADARLSTGIAQHVSGFVTLGSKFVETEVEPEEPAIIEAEKVTVREQLEEFLDFARSSTGGAFQYSLVDLDDEFLDYTHPNEQRIDDYPGTLIRALLGFGPGTVLWWTYEINDDEEIVPTLNFGDSAAMEIAHTLTKANLQRAPINPLRSLLLGKVEVIYDHDTEAGRAQTVHTIAASGDGVTSDREGIFSFNIGNQAVPSVKFAEALAAWAQRLHIAAQPQYLGFDWTRLPGQQWTFGGKFSRYAGKRSTCQQIARDLFARTETVTLGAPPSPEFLSKRVDATTREDTPSTPGGAPGGGGDDDEETGTVTVRIYGLTVALAEKAAWTVGDQSGTNAGALSLPPGTYTAVFQFVVDAASGKIFVAQPKSITVVEGAEVFADGDYEVLDVGPGMPFEIRDISTPGAPMIRVLASTAIDKELDIFEASAASAGFVWVQIPFTESTGDIGEPSIHTGNSMPDSSSSNYIVAIGGWTTTAGVVSEFNYRFGPIAGWACRNWYSDPATYSLTIQ